MPTPAEMLVCSDLDQLTAAVLTQTVKLNIGDWCASSTRLPAILVIRSATASPDCTLRACDEAKGPRMFCRAMMAVLPHNTSLGTYLR